LGMGLRRLSTTPSAIPELKRVCRSVTLSHCRQVAERVLTMENSRDIKSYLREELKKILPEMIT
jgi:phosphotransferase system enzyme I (PtsI)